MSWLTWCLGVSCVIPQFVTAFCFEPLSLVPPSSCQQHSLFTVCIPPRQTGGIAFHRANTGENCGLTLLDLKNDPLQPLPGPTAGGGRDFPVTFLLFAGLCLQKSGCFVDVIVLVCWLMSCILLTRLRSR